MDISVFWHEPVDLEEGSHQNLIYAVNNLEKFEGLSGVYVFCRMYGKNFSPLYIGKASNLAERVRQQSNTTKLMKALHKSPSGKRVLVIGEFLCKPGQNRDKCSRLIEKALIEHALAKDFGLINQQGTKTPYHTIMFSGNGSTRAFAGKQIYVKK